MGLGDGGVREVMQAAARPNVTGAVLTASETVAALQ